MHPVLTYQTCTGLFKRRILLFASMSRGIVCFVTDKGYVFFTWNCKFIKNILKCKCILIHNFLILEISKKVKV